MSLASRGYWRQVRKRIWEQTAKLLPGRNPLIFTALTSVATVLLVGGLFGVDEAKVEMLVVLIPSAVFVGMLVVNAVRAPRILHEEDLQNIAHIEKERDNLKSDLLDSQREQASEDARATQKAAIEKVCTVGRLLLSLRISTEDEWNKWLEIRAALNALIQGLRPQLGPYGFTRIAAAQYNPTIRYVHKFNDEHQRLWNETAACVKAAEEYLKEL